MKKQFYILVSIAFGFQVVLAQELTRFAHHGKILTDKFAELEFYDSNETKMLKKSFEGAKEFCEDLVKEDKDDWHLSNELELDLVYAHKSAFKNLSQEFYWLDKEHDEYTDYAYTLLFYNKDKNYYNKEDENSFICVRGKEYEDFAAFESHVKLMKHKYENGEIKKIPVTTPKDKNTTSKYIVIPAS